MDDQGIDQRAGRLRRLTRTWRFETMATVQAIYTLAGRQAQGFMKSIFEKISLPVPYHSTLSRRRKSLNIALPIRDWSKPRHLVVDSTGVKVYGEGEWKVRQHGISRHGAKATIPPRKGARIWQHDNRKTERHIRDENLRRIRKV